MRHHVPQGLNQNHLALSRIKSKPLYFNRQLLCNQWQNRGNRLYWILRQGKPKGTNLLNMENPLYSQTVDRNQMYTLYKNK